MSDQIKIRNETYKIISQIDNVPIVDSFVRRNKVGRGSGEARLYLGAQTNEKYNFTKFFRDFSSKAFFLKIDFDDYLNDAKFEYEEQEQGYKRDISDDWQEYKDKVVSLADMEYFTIYPVIGEQDEARYYIRSDDEIWRFFRKVMLPIISYVTILKIKNRHGDIFFLFRPTLNYFFNKNYHPAKIREEKEKIEESNIPQEKKMQLVQARNGQGLYRKKLLEEKSECLISKVNDERLIIASHIKPWSISSNKEKIDHYNGLALTPTYDRMFDQGFISFNDNGMIVISPYISPLNIKKLNLIPNKRYDIPSIKHRKIYLLFHRKYIFKK